MCGRVKMASDYSELKIQLKASDFAPPVNIQPRWNAPPTSALPIARYCTDEGRSIEMMKWGLRPFWAKDPKMVWSTFNARSEALETKPAFRDAWKRGRRCLVPVDLFYEWKTLGPKDKQPYAIARAEGCIMTLAGLFESWTDAGSGEVVKSFTIITTEANEQMAPLHTRMPVILDEAQWPAWLGEVPATEAELKAMLKPYEGELAIWPVHRRVGNVKNDDPSLAEPIALQSAS